MTLYRWSQVANNDATADSTINWAEGQAPSSINDSARAMMAATAKYRDDISGAIVTTGTSTAYLVSSYQAFDTLAHLNGQMIAFTPHATNTGAACTLNVDSLTAKPLRSSPNVELPAGTIIQGTPYVTTYNSADGAFYLRGFFGSPYVIPLGATIDFWLTTAPNSSFVFPFGQAISRTTYATLFSLMGTYWGTGDGSTTFNLPDLRGRVVASPDNMGGSDANRLLGNTVLSSRSALGGVGGEPAHTLAASEIPTITSAGSGTISGTTDSSTVLTGSTFIGTGLAAGGNSVFVPNNAGGAPTAAQQHVSGSASVTTSSNNTGGAAHNVMQPTILGNRIMRVI